MQEQVIKVYHVMDHKLVHTANVTNRLYGGQHEALEYAWSATNNKCGSWSRGPQVEYEGRVFENEDYNPDIEVITPLPRFQGKEMGHRSSMTGDVFILNEMVFIVASTGFKHYTGDLAALPLAA